MEEELTPVPRPAPRQSGSGAASECHVFGYAHLYHVGVMAAGQTEGGDDFYANKLGAALLLQPACWHPFPERLHWRASMKSLYLLDDSSEAWRLGQAHCGAF